MRGLDFNSGIRGECRFCGANGFVYYNQSLASTMAMCDACRNDYRRRQEHVSTRTEAYPAGDGHPEAS